MSLYEKLNNLEVREVVKRNVDSAVTSRNTIDSEREHLKDIAALMKEDYDISTSEFNQLVEAAYDREKVEERKDKIVSTLATVEVLYG